jgi:signal transduction histidine kinase
MDNDKRIATNQQISEATSVISHQLKTPLSGIKSSLEILLSKDLGELNKDQKEYLELTLLGVTKMITLVKNILDASRIDEDRLVLNRKPADIAKIVEEVINDLATFAQAKNTEIKFVKGDTIPNINIDALKMKQVIENIVFNAIRYNKGKGMIEIYLQKKDDMAQLSCKDNGISIDEEEKKHIFSKFYRSPQVMALAPDGTGLGLYISKAIVEKHDGYIWFDSKKGDGTTFYISLPIK